jgi:hypothetical protein
VRLRFYESLSINSNNVHLAVRFVELDGAITESEERPIAARAHAFAGMVFGTALTDDDATRENFLAAKQFNAETL